MRCVCLSLCVCVCTTLILPVALFVFFFFIAHKRGKRGKANAQSGSTRRADSFVNRSIKSSIDRDNEKFYAFLSSDHCDLARLAPATNPSFALSPSIAPACAFFVFATAAALTGALLLFVLTNPSSLKGCVCIKFVRMRHSKYAFESSLHCSASCSCARKHRKYAVFSEVHSPKWSKGNAPFSGSFALCCCFIGCDIERFQREIERSRD